MKRKILATRTSVTFVCLLIAVAGCGKTPTPEPDTLVETETIVLRISGSGSTTPILEAVKSAFEADTPNYRLEVLPGTGTGGGVRGILDGTLDVAAMARPPKDEEADQGVKYVQFGQSGVAVYTHPAVQVTDLTTAQATQLFAGEIANWSQVGGPDLDVVLYVRDEGDSSTQALRQAFYGDAQFPATAQVLTSQDEMQSAVSGTPGSVGFGSWASSVAGDVDVSSVSLDGVEPTDPNCTMLATLGIGYLEDRQADVQPLVDWLLSERGQEVLQQFAVITTS